MLPNCIVIGAPRSGTTSMYEYLNAHPAVYMSPVKEPDFFANPVHDSSLAPTVAGPHEGSSAGEGAAEVRAAFAEYEALFEGAAGAAVRGEASAVYLGHPTAAEHIRRHIPDAKLIAVLRDPSERIHSHYMHASRIRADFGADEESQRRSADSYNAVIERAARDGFAGPATTEEEVWLQAGFYCRHVTRWRSLFPTDQMILFPFEELVRDARGVMAKVFRFLGIDDAFVLPTTEAFNATTVPRNQDVFRLFTTRNPLLRMAKALSPTWVRGAAVRTRNRVLSSGKPPLDLARRQTLVGIYRDDILQLQELLGWDLSAWLQDAAAA